MLSILASIIVHSSPHSGTNLTVSCLQYFTKRPKTYLNYDYATLPRSNKMEIELDFDLEPITTCHSSKEVRKHFDPDQDILIFVTRSYKELLARDGRTENIRPWLRGYIDRFRLYDRWNPKRRFLVIYEQFMKDKRGTLDRLLCFLNEDRSKLDDFIENLDFYEKTCLANYKRYTSEVKSTHFQPNQYASKYPKEIIQFFEAIADDIDHQMYTKYLSFWN